MTPHSPQTSSGSFSDADRSIRASYPELNEGNAHIRDMIERLVDSDLEESDARVTLEEDNSGWKVAA